MTSVFDGYDIVGDVHGCADSLLALLDVLGYSKRDGRYQYHDQGRPRQLVFLGDILDRGPQIREAMLIVRELVDSGVARLIMGNHEYYALTYTTPAPPEMAREYLREHTPRHEWAIKETLEQYANYSSDWQDLLAWLYRLPLFIEFEYFRVIHACWDARQVATFCQQYGESGLIDKNFLVASTDYQCFEGRFASRALQGPSLLLPKDQVMTGSHGFERRAFRAKYWIEDPQCFGDVEFQPDQLSVALAGHPLSEQQRQHLPYYGPEQKPLFFGHYWQRGRPQPLTPNLACLDYSAVQSGQLVAYRMHQETHLSTDNFVWVDGHRA